MSSLPCFLPFGPSGDFSSRISRSYSTASGVLEAGWLELGRYCRLVPLLVMMSFHSRWRHMRERLEPHGLWLCQPPSTVASPIASLFRPPARLDRRVRSCTPRTPTVGLSLTPSRPTTPQRVLAAPRHPAICPFRRTLALHPREPLLCARTSLLYPSIRANSSFRPDTPFRLLPDLPAKLPPLCYACQPLIHHFWTSLCWLSRLPLSFGHDYLAQGGPRQTPFRPWSFGPYAIRCPAALSPAPCR